MSKLSCMAEINHKLDIILGFHSHIPVDFQKNNETETIKNHINYLIGLIELLNDFKNIKTNIHFSGNLIHYLDKKNSDFSSKIRTLLDRNQLELFGGGLYEPIFPFLPKEDREAQLLLMNRLLNHRYGYTPSGAWIGELAWEPSLTLDLAKTRINYTCLSKDYFIKAGLTENEINGYYLTEEHGKKVAVFPILYKLESLMQQHSPDETVHNLLTDSSNSEKPLKVLFSQDLITDLSKLTWLRKFFSLLETNNEKIETKLFNEYFLNFKPKGRIYLPTAHDIKLNNTSGFWKHFLLKYPEANLLHKKMLRVSKKINSAFEGKSRFKVIKEMISQAQDLLLKGQANTTYWDNILGGIYSPQERSSTYNNLIKAENLIDSASRLGSQWIQVSEIDYDCDGNDEIIIETETQNIYISPALGGTILEHDFRPKNINLTSVISRKKESYHVNQNGHLIYDAYLKLNLIDHFLENNLSLEQCKRNQLNHLTKEVLLPYQVEKIKAKEDNCKITLLLNTNLIKLESNPEIELRKQISTRSGDSSTIIDYTITNKSQTKTNFIFAVEFNLNITNGYDKDSFFYLDGNHKTKTPKPDLKSSEELNNINQMSIFNKTQGLDLTLSWNKPCNLYRYPIETLSYNYEKLEVTYQGSTILSAWHLLLEPNVPWELSIRQDISTHSEEL